MMANGAAVEIGKTAVLADDSQIIKAQSKTATKSIELSLQPVTAEAGAAAGAAAGTAQAAISIGLQKYQEGAEAAGRKGIILNIETTGYDPLVDRIIAIGWQDADDVSAGPQLLMLEDEKSMLVEFFRHYELNGYNMVIGYGVGFDFRFIMLRAMYYTLTFKEFQSSDMYDLMELMAKGTFDYVYMAQKPPNLSDLADFLFGYPKPFSDTDMLKYYAEGALDKVREFALSQVIRTTALYFLWIYTSTVTIKEGLAGSPASSPVLPPSFTGAANSKLTIPEAQPRQEDTYKCSECLAEFDVAKGTAPSVCPICGSSKLTRIG